MAEHPDVAECAVIGIADAMKGQSPLGLVVLNGKAKRDFGIIEKEIVSLVRERIGPVAAFKMVISIKRLPKTRSGKILRATMQKIADKEEWNMPATIDDPAILDEIARIDEAKRHRGLSDVARELANDRCRTLLPSVERQSRAQIGTSCGLRRCVEDNGMIRTFMLAGLLALVMAVAARADPGMDAYDKQDYVTALKLWQPLADQGNAEAQFGMGLLYDDGYGVKLDDVQAVFWYRKSAAQGYAAAQYNLGVAYDDGEGVAQDKVKAVEWYRLAADQGDADAQFNLAVSYDDGEGVAEDNAEAAKWYRKAADQGDADAQFALGELV